MMKKSNNSKVIVISAHPDDETLGAGGTLLKHKSNSDELYWIIITNIFEDQGFSKKRIQTRQTEIEEVAKIIGFKQVYKLDFPTMTLTSETIIKLVPEIAKLFQEIKPEIVYLVNRSDAHSDHRITFDAVMSCTKSFRHPYLKKVLMYECISETEFAPAITERVFIPNYYVDITQFLDQKLELMQIYQSELGEHPFPRSIRNIEALATFRGAFAGVEYAEAFQLIMYLDK
jgi:LmbE family N-acetylglucosaminyl deacetylase